ncbi:ATP synthase F1, delta subunit [Pseudogymnoascus sp. WSF 3629]|nr:ATP synthase F1, delta subunit [Pseudogymnoascus sp. WSF 3629]
MRLGTGRQDLENLGVAGRQPSNLFPTTTSTPRSHSIAVIKMNVSRAFVRAANTSATRVTIARRAAAQPAIRSYATPASSADTKPPVALYGLDGTYASALYTAAVKTQSLDSVAKALSALQEVYVKDPKLSNIMQAPTLTSEDKSAIIAELQKHTGGQDKADTVKNFLNTLAENNRLALLEGVCTKFGELMGAARGEIELTVTSATPLDNKTLTRLESAVAKSQYVGQGKKLKVTNKVNSDILGGLVVEIGDRTIDLSVSSRISKMNKLLTDTL